MVLDRFRTIFGMFSDRFTKLGLESSKTAGTRLKTIRNDPQTVRNRPKPSENGPKPSETVRNRPKAKLGNVFLGVIF